MSDIAKCNGVRSVKYLNQDAVCPLRDSCYRYKAPLGLQQTWIEAPFKLGERRHLTSCPMYWRIKAGDVLK